MRDIYLLLMHSGSLPSELVRRFTTYEYSHVAISLDKDCNTLYSFGRKRVHNFLIGGFTKLNKNDEFYKVFNKTKCIVYKMSIEDDKYLKLKEILDSYEKNSEIYKYDFLGALFNYLNIDKTFKDKYTCAHFVAKCLYDSNIYKFDKPLSLVVPKDFNRINELKEIYSGNYLSYGG